MGEGRGVDGGGVGGWEGVSGWVGGWMEERGDRQWIRE